MYVTGQTVKVSIGENEATASMAVREFQGFVTKIKEVKPYKGAIFTYILEDVYSLYGVYYEFAEEWLIPWVEVKR